MVTPVPPAARGLLVVAGLLAALLVPAAEAADATATMTVRARVVDRCRIRLPDRVPPHARDRIPDHARHLIEHRCRRPQHPQVTAAPSARRPTDRQAPGGVAWSRHNGRGPIVITLTY